MKSMLQIAVIAPGRMCLMAKSCPIDDPDKPVSAKCLAFSSGAFSRHFFHQSSISLSCF